MRSNAQPAVIPLTEDPEAARLAKSDAREQHWMRWGPYLSDRAWGTVREDYSDGGTAWESFPHDHARSRAYRWNEDGLLGISDRHQRICFGIALWNGRDPILKERLFGLTGNEGNHGEDAKEYWFYLDCTPTHSYMKALYKYPQMPFPYDDLLHENQRRGRGQPEYELLDTGVFAEQRYFDVVVTYAKRSPEDLAICIDVINRGPDVATLHLLPTIWFRNTWTWQNDTQRPSLSAGTATASDCQTIELSESYYGRRFLYAEGRPQMLFTENETNHQRLFGSGNAGPYVKDAFHRYLIENDQDAINPRQVGTKGAFDYILTVAPGAQKTVRLRLTDAPQKRPFSDHTDIIETRRQEADLFYRNIIPDHLSEDAQRVMRQGFAGMLWSKQYYHYVIDRWLEGDPTQPEPSKVREWGRNHDWRHLYNADVISMPDKWEYPWYAAWDLAFHCVPLALVDPTFAKEQLILMLREWYMHPNGQLPAYEWAFGDVNPPVHAWAALRVYQIEKKRRGAGDRAFLTKVFHKLLLNFTWWVNRKDIDGKNVFQGGFLGLDNIGVFDRSAPLPTGGHLEQSDGTSWMAMYTLNLLAIALELAKEDPSYEDVASKFWEHFLHIANAMNGEGSHCSLWDDEDGFYYDVLHHDGQPGVPLKIRSMVGLIPLFAVTTIEPDLLKQLPGFERRMRWFLENRPKLTGNVACMRTPGQGERRLMSIVNAERLKRVLSVMLDENEFLSRYGIRALSRRHLEQPFALHANGNAYAVQYEPGESSTGLFGGNSNWRGPIWFPVNYLLVEALQKFHHYFGDSFTVECPTGSGNEMTLWQVAAEISRRLTHIFLRDADGQRPVHGDNDTFQTDPHWRDMVLFYEYFHGDNGRGVGASHQTGWTGLVTKLIQQSGE